MIKDHIIDLLDSELYEQLIEELQNNKIDKELFYKVVVLKFKEWQFHIIENLLFLNLISEGFVRKLIMKNDNLGASMYMIKEMSNVEDIILNMDNLISKNLKFYSNNQYKYFLRYTNMKYKEKLLRYYQEL